MMGANGRDHEMKVAYEAAWKEKFARRLDGMCSSRGIGTELLADTMECSEERARALLAGEDFPTMPELLRLCFLCYDADEILLGARDEGLYYLVRGKRL